MNYTEEQQKIIETVDGFCLVVACPGSGKTTTMLARIKHMIDVGIEPRHITMVTFTKAAAMEMEKRFKQSYSDMLGVNFCTIHSLCYNILRTADPYRRISVVSDSEKELFVYNALKQYLRDINEILNYKDKFLSELNFVQNQINFDIDTYVPEFKLSRSQDAFKDLYLAYQKYKSDHDKLDFDDMLREALNTLRANKLLLDRWQEAMPYIIIDEFQDTNTIQANLFYLLSQKYGNLCVVGDDDQSIYGFRNADPKIMQKFPQVYPNTKVFTLSTNYRSGAEIIEASKNLISRNTLRYKKDFEVGRKDIKGELKIESLKKADYKKIEDTIKKAKGNGLAYKDIAILYRTNQEADLLVAHLSQTDIPLNVVGAVKDIHEEFYFKNLKNYYDLLKNDKLSPSAKKEAFLNILNTPNRFLTVSIFKNFDLNANNITGWNFDLNSKNIEDCIKTQLEKTKKTTSSHKGFFEMQIKDRLTELNNLCKKLNKTTSLQSFASTLFNDNLYRKWAFKKTNEMNVPEDIVKESMNYLIQEAANFQTMDEWLSFNEAQRLRKTKDEYKKPEGVVLSTFHGAKGLEWDTVILLNVTEDNVPYKRAITSMEIEEERRLFYVAMTRAKNTLLIQTIKDAESSFLDEIICVKKEKDMSNYYLDLSKSSANAPKRQYKVYEKHPSEKYLKEETKKLDEQLQNTTSLIQIDYEHIELPLSFANLITPMNPCW